MISRPCGPILATVPPVAHEVERTPVDLKDNPAIDDTMAPVTATAEEPTAPSGE